MVDVIFFGQPAMDAIYHSSTKEGGDWSFTYQFGGACMNAAAAYAQLSTKRGSAGIIGRVGKDDLGERILAECTV